MFSGRSSLASGCTDAISTGVSVYLLLVRLVVFYSSFLQTAYRTVDTSSAADEIQPIKPELVTDLQAVRL